MTDGDVDAVKFGLLVSQVVESLLVNDGVDRNSGFASLSVIGQGRVE